MHIQTADIQQQRLLARHLYNNYIGPHVVSMPNKIFKSIATYSGGYYTEPAAAALELLQRFLIHSALLLLILRVLWRPKWNILKSASFIRRVYIHWFISLVRTNGPSCKIANVGLLDVPLTSRRRREHLAITETEQNNRQSCSQKPYISAVVQQQRW